MKSCTHIHLHIYNYKSFHDYCIMAITTYASLLFVLCIYILLCMHLYVVCILLCVMLYIVILHAAILPQAVLLSPRPAPRLLN